MKKPKTNNTTASAAVDRTVDHVSRGLALAERERYEAAREEFSLAIVVALFNRAEALRRLLRTAEAIADLEQALSIAPNYDDARVQLGRCLYEARRFNEAETALRAHLSAHPDDAGNWQLLGDVQRLAGRLHDAKHSLLRAVRLSNGENIDAVACLATVRWTLREPDSVVTLTDGITLAPQDSWLYAQRSGAFRRLGRLDLAVKDADAALACESPCRWAYVLRGVCRLQRGDFALARADFRKLRNGETDKGFALAFTGEAYRLQGDFERAVAAFDAALALPGDDSETYARLHRAATVLAMGHTEVACAEIERILDELTDDDDAGLRAEALGLLGRADDAAATLERAFDRDWTAAILAEGEALQRPLLADPRLATRLLDARSRAAGFTIPSVLYPDGAPSAGSRM